MRKLGLLSFGVAAVVASASLSNLAFGQATTLGSIVGTVFDPTAAAVPGANVRVVNTQTGVARETLTSDNGHFSVLSLIPGPYSVEVTAPNFQRQVQENLRLEVAGSISLVFRLTVGQVAESITVQAEGELLKATEGVISTTVDNQKVGGPTLNGQTWAVTGQPERQRQLHAGRHVQ
jgi:uncharacterized surface anchored protein